MRITSAAMSFLIELLNVDVDDENRVDAIMAEHPGPQPHRLEQKEVKRVALYVKQALPFFADSVVQNAQQRLERLVHELNGWAQRETITTFWRLFPVRESGGRTKMNHPRLMVGNKKYE